MGAVVAPDGNHDRLFGDGTVAGHFDECALVHGLIGQRLFVEEYFYLMVVFGQ